MTESAERQASPPVPASLSDVARAPSPVRERVASDRVQVPRADICRGWRTLPLNQYCLKAKTLAVPHPRDLFLTILEQVPQRYRFVVAGCRSIFTC